MTSSPSPRGEGVGGWGEARPLTSKCAALQRAILSRFRLTPPPARSPRGEGVLVALIALAACTTTSAPTEPPSLRDLIWTDHTTNIARALTNEPGECLASRNHQIESGRALFNSRTLLGGPAARVGLSCASCHTNGRANAHFLLPELTHIPGHADVTSEWSSKIRGDGIANPIPIPDLAGVSSRTTFGQQRDPSLANFIRSVIVDEFQGPEPNAATQTALLAYLTALDSNACAPETQIRIATLTNDIRRAFTAAAQEQDPQTRDLLYLATQDALARLAERLPIPAFTTERTNLESLSRALTTARTSTPPPNWLARFNRISQRLERREPETYASEQTLRRVLSVSQR